MKKVYVALEPILENEPAYISHSDDKFNYIRPIKCMVSSGIRGARLESFLSSDGLSIVEKTSFTQDRLKYWFGDNLNNKVDDE